MLILHLRLENACHFSLLVRRASITTEILKSGRTLEPKRPDRALWILSTSDCARKGFCFLACRNRSTKELDFSLLQIRSTVFTRGGRLLARRSPCLPSPLRVVGDVVRLQQVLWNLLKNASKFTPEGGEIPVTSRNETSLILLEIPDTGIGIEHEALSTIFNAFNQGSEGIAREFGGLGLGLAISKAFWKHLRPCPLQAGHCSLCQSRGNSRQRPVGCPRAERRSR